jgi:hypothetical protein
LRLGFETDENGFVTGVPADHPTDRNSVRTSLEEIIEWLEQGIPDGQENFRIAAILARRKACSMRMTLFLSTSPSLTAVRL